MPEIRDLSFALMQSQATMARLEKERLQDMIMQVKKQLPDMWAEVY